MTVIKECDCKNDFQDKTYGSQKRVFNLTGKCDTSGEARCTVCGKIIKVRKPNNETIIKKK